MAIMTDYNNYDTADMLHSNIQDIKAFLENHGGYITNVVHDIENQNIYSMGSMSPNTVPYQSNLRMEVVFQLPLKNGNFTFPPKVTTKIVKEKLTDQEIIERYHQIMEERSNNQPQVEGEYQHLEI